MFGLSPLKAAGVFAAIVVLGAGAWYVMDAEAAKARAAKLDQQLVSVRQVAEENSAEAERLRRQLKNTEQVLAERDRQRRKAREKAAELQAKLAETLKGASDEVQQCMRVRLPGDTVRVLRGDAGGSAEDEDGNGDTPGAADAEDAAAAAEG